MATPLVKATRITNGGFDIPQISFTIAGLASTASETVIDGSETNIVGFPEIMARFICATQNVTVNVYLATAADFSNEFQYRALAVVVGTPVFFFGASVGTTFAPMPLPYIRFKLIDTVGGVHGTLTMHFGATR